MAGFLTWQRTDRASATSEDRVCALRLLGR